MSDHRRERLVFLTLGFLLSTAASLECGTLVSEYACGSGIALDLSGVSIANKLWVAPTTRECQQVCLDSCYPALDAECLKAFAQGCEFTLFERKAECALNYCVKAGGLWWFEFAPVPIVSESRFEVLASRRPFPEVLAECASGNFQLMEADSAEASGYRMCTAGRYPAVRGPTTPFRAVNSSQVLVDVTSWVHSQQQHLQGAAAIDVVFTGCCASQLQDTHPLLKAFLTPLDTLQVYPELAAPATSSTTATEASSSAPPVTIPNTSVTGVQTLESTWSSSLLSMSLTTPEQTTTGTGDFATHKYAISSTVMIILALAS